MKILYVAHHARGDNDDEGAIAFALEELGHQVVRIPEKTGSQAIRERGDFLLCHHWNDTTTLSRVSIPKVFWCFDEVSSTDPSIRGRSDGRIKWINRLTQHVMLGLCTDGDWVAQDTTGKLVQLMQGADARRAGLGTPLGPEAGIAPIIFTGMSASGGRRATHIAELQDHYGEQFQVHGDRGGSRVHGRALARVLATAQVIIAPDSPATNHYWSNRVYLTLGLGGFLLHPYCEDLTKQYEPDKELVYYKTRQELLAKIDYYLVRPEARHAIQQAGFWRTMAEHTYLRRCEQLIELVRERLPAKKRPAHTLNQQIRVR